MSADVELQLLNLKTYREVVIPAYRTFMDKGDAAPLIALLKEIVTKIDKGEPLPYPEFWNRESYEEDIGILDGSVYYSLDGSEGTEGGKTTAKAKRVYVRDNLSAKLVLGLCVPYTEGVNSSQDMTKSPLVNYLYSKSRWIQEMFTFERTVRGEALEVRIGESSELFTKEDLREFASALEKVPVPEASNLRDEFQNLRALVQLALQDPDLTLVLSVV